MAILQGTCLAALELVSAYSRIVSSIVKRTSPWRSSPCPGGSAPRAARGHQDQARYRQISHDSAVSIGPPPANTPSARQPLIRWIRAVGSSRVRRTGWRSEVAPRRQPVAQAL